MGNGKQCINFLERLVSKQKQVDITLLLKENQEPQ